MKCFRKQAVPNGIILPFKPKVQVGAIVLCKTLPQKSSKKKWYNPDLIFSRKKN